MSASMSWIVSLILAVYALYVMMQELRMAYWIIGTMVKIKFQVKNSTSQVEYGTLGTYELVEVNNEIAFRMFVIHIVTRAGGTDLSM